MKYRIILSDKSFLVTDENYVMCLFKQPYAKPKKIKVKDFLKPLNIKRFQNYYFVEAPKTSYENPNLLTFTVEEYQLPYDLPVNSRYKMSQDIAVGDVVLGENGEPDVVTELHSGNEEMYELEIDGEKIVVNGGHILHLQDKETRIPMDMPVNIYLTLSDEFRQRYIMIKEEHTNVNDSTV